MFHNALHTMTRTFGVVHRYHRASRKMAALGRLDQRTLSDIGIERSSIPTIAMSLAASPRTGGWRHA